MQNLSTRLAQEVSASQPQIEAAVRLMDEGATVPFIARYRKEATGGLDDGQLRTLHERLNYLRELDERRTSILKNIGEQGQLTTKLKQQIEQADSKVRLEDLYLPFKKNVVPRAMWLSKQGSESWLMPCWQTHTSNPKNCPNLYQS